MKENPSVFITKADRSFWLLEAGVGIRHGASLPRNCIRVMW